MASKIAKARARKLAALEEQKTAKTKAQPAQPKRSIKEINSHLSAGKVSDVIKSKKKSVAEDKLNLRQKFAMDNLSLKGLSLAQKTALKRKYIEKYRSYCEAFARTAEPGKQDEIFQNWVVWLFDVGIEDEKIREQFIVYTKEAIRLEQKPKFIKRSPLEFMQWSIVSWAEEEHGAGRSPDPWFSKAFEDVEDWEKVQTQLARRALTLKFKLLQEAGELKEAAEIGKIALEHKAKIKTRYMEVQVALGK